MKQTNKSHHEPVSRILFVILILAIWEYAAKNQAFGPNTELIFPSLERIAAAFVNNFKVGYAGISLWVYVLNSMKLLLTGLFLGIMIAFIFSGVSMICKPVYHIYNMLVSVCDLLPGIALLPVIIVIFGINEGVIIFLVVHAVLWPMSRSLLDGFMAVPRIYVEAGMNIGLRGARMLTGIYIPATMSYIMSGLKSGWARAWRGLISAEMIFGIASCPGIGLFINQMRTNMNNAEMYATLIVIILIGIIVQYGILSPIENSTVKRWGMSR